jgi:hypothetical protein
MPEYPKYIFKCVDARGIQIKCLYEDWQYLLKHQEMRDNQKIVQEIIQNPDYINRDKDFKNRENYYKVVTLSRNRITLVKVIVELKKPLFRKSGYLYNAFACGVEKPGEVRIWTKS